MTLTIKVSGHYERHEIPPRCRKPRPVLHDTTTTVTVDTVTSEEAPVAFRVTGLCGPGETEPPIREIRTHAGRLYTPFTPTRRMEDPAHPGSSRFPTELVIEPRRYGGIPSTPEEYDREVQKEFSVYLIIDGTVWEETPEPGYHVMTFGLGGINGSTALMVDSRTDYGTLFRADEFEAARDYAATISAERGDDEARYAPEAAEDYRAIEVLIPEAVTLVTVPPTPRAIRDLRFEYRTARDRLSHARTPDEDAEQFAEVVRLREAIIEAGHSPVKTDGRPYEARHGQEG